MVVNLKEMIEDNEEYEFLAYYPSTCIQLIAGVIGRQISVVKAHDIQRLHILKYRTTKDSGASPEKYDVTEETTLVFCNGEPRNTLQRVNSGKEILDGSVKLEHLLYFAKEFEDIFNNSPDAKKYLERFPSIKNIYEKGWLSKHQI